MWRLVVIPPLLVFLGWVVWNWTPATYTVKNESGQLIRVLIVGVGEKTYRYENIPAGGEVSGSFYYGHETNLSVRGQLTDGTSFDECCAYLVWEDFAPHVGVVVGMGGQVARRESGS